jgi:hemerythrin-like metal-binding protein
MITKFFEWQDSYSIGNEKVDEQHQKLVELINTLYHTDSSNEDEIILEVLADMLDYIKFHFSYEEKLMIESDYPDYKLHRKEHFEFVKKWNEFNREFIEGDAYLTSKQIGEYLKDWLITHILGTDKKFWNYIQNS